MTSTAWGVGLLSGAPFGTLTGIRTGFVEHSVLGGLVVGLLGGAIFGAVMGLVFGRRLIGAVQDLSPPDRTTVMRAVRKGQAVPERRLAPAVIDYAESLRQESRRPLETKGGNRLVLGALVVLSAGLAIAEGLGGDWIGAAGHSMLTVLWLVLVLLSPPLA